MYLPRSAAAVVDGGWLQSFRNEGRPGSCEQSLPGLLRVQSGQVLEQLGLAVKETSLRSMPSSIIAWDFSTIRGSKIPNIM